MSISTLAVRLPDRGTIVVAAAAAFVVGAVWYSPLLFGYAIHAGDALVKTLLMTVILGVWRR